MRFLVTGTPQSLRLRHPPQTLSHREGLVLTVYRHDIAPLLEQHPPLEALRLWLDRLAHYRRIKHRLAAVPHPATSDGLAGKNHGPVIARSHCCRGPARVLAASDPA